MRSRAVFPPAIGIGFGITLGFIYLVALYESGEYFYLFAKLIFIGAPLVAGITAAITRKEHRLKTFFYSGSAVFGVLFGLFLVVYAVVPQFERTNVQLPDSCTGFDGSFNPPTDISYVLPDGNTGILIISDADTAVVATIDDDQPLFPTSVLIIDQHTNMVLQKLKFNNDVVSAAIGNGIIYIYNDKIGDLFDARTGRSKETYLIIDNYGGLSASDKPVVSRASDGHWYMETTAVVSSWGIDGTVVSRPHLIFNGIARGCYISGSTNAVISY